MQARQLPARHGVIWLLAGFRLFRRNPPLLTALTFAYFFCVILFSLIPALGPLLLPLVLPALTVIVANGCRTVEAGRPVTKSDLQYGFAAHGATLLRLGSLHLAASLLVLFVTTLIEGGSQRMPAMDAIDPGAMLAMLARLLLIASPVIMAFWFAPLLTGWDGVPPLKSLFFSFVASVRNWRAFAMYGLGVGVAAVGIPGLALIAAAAISQHLFEILSVALRMLLIFIIAPVLMASVYLSYRDVFHGIDEHA